MLGNLQWPCMALSVQDVLLSLVRLIIKVGVDYSPTRLADCFEIGRQKSRVSITVGLLVGHPAINLLPLARGEVIMITVIGNPGGVPLFGGVWIFVGSHAKVKKRCLSCGHDLLVFVWFFAN